MSTLSEGSLTGSAQLPRRILRWVARGLMLLWVGFWVWFSVVSGISEWAATGDPAPFWGHQLLSVVLLGLAWLSWRRELLGGVFFATLPLLMLVVFGHTWPTDKSVILLLEAPPLLIGLLLVMNWIAHR